VNSFFFALFVFFFLLTLPDCSLANVEMRLTMCRILWNFDLELHDDCRNWMQEQKTFTLWEKEPLKIRLRNISH
jgi:hypothetical protein